MILGTERTRGEATATAQYREWLAIVSDVGVRISVQERLWLRWHGRILTILFSLFWLSSQGRFTMMKYSSTTNASSAVSLILRCSVAPTSPMLLWHLANLMQSQPVPTYLWLRAFFGTSLALWTMGSNMLYQYHPYPSQSRHSPKATP